jgi:four helix bundle protein
LAVEYRLSYLEPIKSDWGLKDQFRRAALSMSDNIAEGFEYNKNTDFVRFLRYSKGSSGEFRNKLIVLKAAGKITSLTITLCMTLQQTFALKQRNLVTIW